MIKTLLHIDLLDSELIYDSILKTHHAYNAKILVNKTYKNIKEISIKSIEFPIFFNNIRSINNSNLFYFIFSYSTFNNISLGISIPEDNYNTISSLLTAINNALTSNLSSYIGLYIVLSVVNKYYIQITHNCSSLTLNKCILIHNILGFNIETYNNSPIISNNFYCLNIDNYVNLYITNLSGQEATDNGRLLSFKIIYHKQMVIYCF